MVLLKIVLEFLTSAEPLRLTQKTLGFDQTQVKNHWSRIVSERVTYKLHHDILCYFVELKDKSEILGRAGVWGDNCPPLPRPRILMSNAFSIISKETRFKKNAI